MGEANEVKWVGVRPTDPAEDIPVTLDGEELVVGMPAGALAKSLWGLANNTVVNLYNVPAGKTLYLCTTIIVVNNLTAGNARGEVRIYNTVPAIDTYLQGCEIGPNQLSNIPMQFIPPMPVITGYSVRVSSNATNCFVSGTFYGYII